MSNKDQFGFYQVGNFRTYSKLEALEKSQQMRQPVDWNFNREVFNAINWQAEPPGTLDFYYAVRAKQIRDKYDYIVLWFSGGADSHNVLNTFVKNNIFIDEIAQYHSLEGSQGNKKNLLNEEVFATSAPITVDLIQNNPVYKNTVHRLVDISQIIAKVNFFDSNKWDYFYKVNTYLSPGALSRSYIREIIPAYQDLINSGKKVCFLWALEKPAVTKENNQWLFSFKDGFDHTVSARAQMLNRDWEHDEFFYWSPDLPELVCKQAHVVKRYLEKITDQDVDGYHVQSGKPMQDAYGIDTNQIEWSSVVVNHGKTYTLTYPGLHRLIYSDWNPNLIVGGKPASLIFNQRDEWFYNPMNNDIGGRHFGRGVAWLRNHIKNINSDSWWEFKFCKDNNRPYAGGITAIKNQYVLGPVRDQT
jgi:hypothetical protein